MVRCFLLLAVVLVNSSQADDAEFYRLHSQALCRVENFPIANKEGKSTISPQIGTAFRPIESDLLITAAHVTAGSKEVVVYIPGKRSESRVATVIAYDEARDLAALQIPDFDIRNAVPGLPLAENNGLKPGAAVRAVGYGLNKIDGAFLDGKVSTTDFIPSGWKLPANVATAIAIDMTPTPGFSGTPILSPEVIGVHGVIANAHFEKIRGPENIDVLGGEKTIALPVTIVKDFLANYKKLPPPRNLVALPFKGPVNLFVSASQGTLFAHILWHSSLEEDGEVVEGLLPVMNRHRPLA